MINQEATNNFLSGTQQDIVMHAGIMDFTPGQTYFAITCTLIMLCFVAFLIYSVVKTLAIKSCTSCSRLRKCENDIAEIRKNLVFNDVADIDILKSIKRDLEKLRKFVNGSRND